MSEPPSDDPEQQIALWLRANPGFLQRHPELLPHLKMPDVHAGRAISLHERQMEVMREKHRQLEHRLAELMRVAQENDLIGERVQRFTRAVLLHEDRKTLPDRISGLLGEVFQVPQVAMRLWPPGSARHAPGVQLPVEPAVVAAADGLHHPLCGSPANKPGVSWLPEAGKSARSVALLALRRGAEAEAFGLLVLGSGDPDRFQAQMGTAFLQRLAEMISAALTPALGPVLSGHGAPTAGREVDRPA